MGDADVVDAAAEMQETESSSEVHSPESIPKENFDDNSNGDAEEEMQSKETQLSDQFLNYKVGDPVCSVYGKGIIKEVREDGE